MRVAFLGTGLLGSGMVEAMLNRGLDVTVWNRTPSRAHALETRGAKLAVTAESAVTGAEFVHLALSDDAAVEEILSRIVPHIDSKGTIVDHTTTSPAGTVQRLKQATMSGSRMLHAPVFMSPQMCRDAVGLMLVSGQRSVYGLAQQHLAKMTGEVWYLGEREDLAAAYKILGNSMIFSLTAGLADVFAMSKAIGIAPEDAAGLFSKFKVGSIISMRAEKMARRDFTATFELTMARKDMRLMIEAAGQQRLTILPAIAAKMDEAIAKGHGKHDMGAITQL
jgi:3-hydroxyisobutyrate dehydrogenase-like beta-hydroxyacid dehydrogenase